MLHSSLSSALPASTHGATTGWDDATEAPSTRWVLHHSLGAHVTLAALKHSWISIMMLDDNVFWWSVWFQTASSASVWTVMVNVQCVGHCFGLFTATRQIWAAQRSWEQWKLLANLLSC